MNNLNAYWNHCYDSGRDFITIGPQSLTTLLSYVKKDQSKNCLDIGCGSGQLTRELQHRGYRCVGVDASSSAIKLAQSATTSADITYLHLDIEQANPADLPNQPYSLITCKLVYAFIINKPNFLANVCDLLADQGTFVVITPLKPDVPPEKSAIAVDFKQH